MNFDFYTIIKKGTKAVPATNYGIGIMGIVATVALILKFQTDLQIAILGTIIMIGLMILLVIFAKLTETAAEDFKKPVKVLMWSVVILFICSCFLLSASAFFGWPKLHSLSEQHHADSTKSFITSKLILDTSQQQKNQNPKTEIKINRSPEATVVVGDDNKLNNK